MKFLPFIYKNILRNKRRTLLIFFSLSFALFLFVFLFTVLSSMNKAIYQPGTMDTIFVINKVINKKNSNIPQSYADEIKKLPHVVGANPCLQVFSFFEKSTKVFNVWGIIPDKLYELVDVTKIDGSGTDGLSEEKRAALVGYNKMEEYQWKIGDRIILKSGAFQKDIPFTIKGVVHGSGNASDLVYLNLNYLQNILNNQGRVSFIYIKTADASFIPEISRNAEALFRNYPVEIVTMTQKSFMDSIVDKIKAILIAFRLIGWITIISTFILVANCIAIRERRTEIGVLRVLGFSRAKIFTFVLTESMVVAAGGGMLGAFLAYLLLTIYRIDIPAVVTLHVAPDASLVAFAFLISMMIGFFGGIFPSISSVFMKLGDAIRGIG